MSQTNAPMLNCNTHIDILKIKNLKDKLDKVDGLITEYNHGKKYRIQLEKNTTRKNLKDSLLHELVHFLFMYVEGVESTHTKKFWRILKFLDKEFGGKVE